MLKWYIIGTLLCITAGFVLIIGLYLAYFYYVAFLGIATMIMVPVMLNSLYHKDPGWKFYLKFLAFGYIIFLTASLRLNWLEFRQKERGDKVIEALYDYRHKNGKFPLKLEDLQKSFASTRGHYVPDSSLAGFRFFYRNLFGVPRVFSSKDSTWRL